ncbi:MAG: MoxR family ATPase [Deltaproteobacteria bacterium]|nr:MoxR family ATPase [Deltaproteobacteria bacterium]
MSEIRIKDNVAEERGRIELLISNIEKVFLGKTNEVKLALTALLAKGHILFEDVPGVGKTTLARAVARSIGGSFKRIQFTSDMLPSDIIGVTVFEKEGNRFVFKEGPLFANIILADEINRASPRTQSALLESMNETQVTVDSSTYLLKKPFLVMATQNPQELHGTYPLPESQLDRFLMRISLGYPERNFESTIVKSHGFHYHVEEISPVVSSEDIVRMQSKCENIHFDANLLEYMMQIVAETRRQPDVEIGISTRGAIGLYTAAKARAFVDGRHYVIPDDVKNLAIPVFCHRMILRSRDRDGDAREEACGILSEIMRNVPVPV